MTIGIWLIMVGVSLLGIVAGFFMGLAYSTSTEIDMLEDSEKRADWE